MPIFNPEKYEAILHSSGIKLLGQIEISNEEYEELKQYFIKNVLENRCYSRINLRLAFFLVQVAIREYKEGKFWIVMDEILNCSLTQAQRNNIYDKFISTIRYYDLFEIPSNNNRNQFVEIIKSHAFVTNYYMDGYFEFVKSFYETVLFRQFVLSEISDDIEDLRSFMASSLEQGDSFSVDIPGKVSKFYKLLKSTRSVFAYCEKETINSLFCSSLKMLDDYYYDGVLPEIKDRFSASFCDWCKSQDEINSQSSHKHSRKIISRKPFLHLISSSTQVFAITIPSQKFRSNECDGSAYAKIVFGDEEYTSESNSVQNINEQTVSLDVYQSFGISISDEKTIRISSPFDAITINIYNDSDNKLIKSYRIYESKYRILDAKYKAISKLKYGENILVVKHDEKTQHNEYVSSNLIFSNDQWDIYALMCVDGAEIKFGVKTLRYTTRNYVDMIFECICDDPMNIYNFYVTDNQDTRIPATPIHPIIEFQVEKIKANGISLYINNQKLTLKEIECDYPHAISKENNIVNADKIQISIDFEEIIDSSVGYYKVAMSVPGESTNVIIGEYIRFSSDMYVKRNARLYYYETELKITIKNNVNDGLSFIPCNTDVKSNPVSVKKDDVIVTTYFYERCDNIDSANFTFKMDGHNFTIHIPIPKVKVGNSVETLTFRKTTFWYKELSDNFYVLMPGVISMQMSLECNGRNILSIATHLGDGLFKFDLAELNEVIRSRNNRQRFNVDIMFVDTRQRGTAFVIYRQPNVRPYFDKIEMDPQTGLMYTDIDTIDTIDGMADVYLEIEEVATHEILFGAKVVPGRNYFPEMKHNKDYWIKPYMVEKTLFSTVKTPMKWIKFDGEKDYSDPSQCYVSISQIIHNNRTLHISGYVYSINNLKQTGETTYCGCLKAIKLKHDGKPDFRSPMNNILGSVQVVFEEFGKRTTARLYMLEFSERNWVEPYYDIKRQQLIGPNNKLLLSSNYDGFIPLYDDDTLFILELRHRKGRNNDIQTDRELQKNS